MCSAFPFLFLYYFLFGKKTNIKINYFMLHNVSTYKIVTLCNIRNYKMITSGILELYLEQQFHLFLKRTNIQTRQRSNVFLKQNDASAFILNDTYYCGQIKTIICFAKFTENKCSVHFFFDVVIPSVQKALLKLSVEELKKQQLYRFVTNS